MFELERCIEDQLREFRGSLPTLIFPEADDPRIISAASELIQHAKIVLVRKQEDVVRDIDHHAIPLKVSKKRFIQSVSFVTAEDHPELVEEFATEFKKKSVGRSWQVDLERARRMVREPVFFSILAVRLGYADAVLGGVRHPSRDFFQPCLRLLERDGTVYEMALFALPDSHPEGLFKKNLVMFADVALNPVPDPERLADIAVGACATMRNILPESALTEVNGALLSYSTRGSGAGASVDRIRQAEPIIQQRLAGLAEAQTLYKSINIAAELQIGVAISRESARTKLGDAAGYNPAVGAANVLIAPTLDEGNLLYHIYVTKYPEATPVLIIGGLKDQALDFSRGSQTADVVIGAKALMLRLYRSGRFSGTRHDTFFPRHKLLTIDPVMGYTEIGLWAGRDECARDRLDHDPEVLAKAPMDQLPKRLEAVKMFVAKHGIAPSELRAVVGRGGLLAPMESGTYRVNNRMIDHLSRGRHGDHVVNLGAILAREIAGEGQDNVFVVDPAVVDEQDEVARVSGLAGIQRRAIWHALAQKSVAKTYAAQHGREYENLNLIVAYLGAGISVGAHRHGRCVKVNNALAEGPMSLERAGSLSNLDVVELCYSGMSKDEILRKIIYDAGVRSYLGISDFSLVEGRVASGDSEAELVVSAMAEQISAQIASLVPKFMGDPVQQILLTGELAHSEMLVERIIPALDALGIEITVFPGNQELEGLRDGALRVLNGFEPARDY